MGTASSLNWFYGMFFIVMGSIPAFIYLLLVSIGRWKQKHAKRSKQRSKRLVNVNSSNTENDFSFGLLSSVSSISPAKPNSGQPPPRETKSICDLVTCCCRRCWDIFPLFELDEGANIIYTHLISPTLFLLASVSGMVESVVGDPSGDPATCRWTWRMTIFFGLSFQISVLWFLYFRAELAAQIAEQEKVMKFLKMFLIAYSIGNPIVGTISVDSAVVFGDGTNVCVLIFPLGALTAVVVLELLLESCLFFVFVVPVWRLRTDALLLQDKDATTNNHNNVVTSNANQQGKTRIEKLDAVVIHGFSVSCAILVLMMISISLYFPDPLKYGSVTQVIAPVFTAFIFYTVVYSTRHAWKRPTPVTATKV